MTQADAASSCFSQLSKGFIVPNFPAAPFRLSQLPLLVGLAASGVSVVHAQAGAGALQIAAGPALKEVVVSGSRNEQPSEDLPVSIDVLDAQKLEANQVRDIRDAARELPNVSVQRSPTRFNLAQSPTGRAGNAGFNVRGLDGNRVLLLIDGLRTPRAYNFNAASFGRDYFDVGLVKRVEVLKGSASALYGSDGLAGLVNFITKDPEDFLEAGATFGGQASARYGSDNDGLTLGLTLAGRASDRVDYLIGITGTRASELDNQGSNDALNVNRTTPNPQKDSNRSLLGKLVWRPNADQKHSFTFEHVERKSDYDVITARSAPPLNANSALLVLANDDASRDRLTWDGRFKLDALFADRLQAQLSYQNADAREFTFEDRNGAADRTRDNNYSERTLQANVQFDKTLPIAGGWVQKITYGFDLTQAKLSNFLDGLVPPAGETFPLRRFPDTKESSVALYIQDEIASEYWSITPGVRIDRYKIGASQAGFSPPSTTPAASLSDSAVSPKLGALYKLTPQVGLYANYAAGFRAPNANQVNNFFESFTQFYRTLPNPNLRPERSRSFEVGSKGRLDNLSYDLALFTGRYKDFIEDGRVISGPAFGLGTAGNQTTLQSVNLSSVRISGFEFKGDFDWGRVGSGRLSSPFSYGQSKGRDTSNGRPLNSIDPEKLFVGLKYDTGAFDIRLGLTYRAAKDAQDIDSAALVVAPATQFAPPSSTVFDLSGQYRINKDLRLTAAVYNLTDRRVFYYSDVRGVASNSNIIDSFSQPGRHLVVSLVADF